MSRDLSDKRIDEICEGLTQNAAKIRYLRHVLKLTVARKPNGRPLVNEAHYDAVMGGSNRPDPAARRAGGIQWSVP